MMGRDKALKHLRGSLRKATRGDELLPAKVSVMADSEEGLEEGLDKAKDLLESGVVPSMGESDEELEEKLEGESEEMEDEDDLQEILASVTPEKAAELIELLKAKLA